VFFQIHIGEIAMLNYTANQRLNELLNEVVAIIEKIRTGIQDMEAENNALNDRIYELLQRVDPYSLDDFSIQDSMEYEY